MQVLACSSHHPLLTTTVEEYLNHKSYDTIEQVTKQDEIQAPCQLESSRI